MSRRNWAQEWDEKQDKREEAKETAGMQAVEKYTLYVCANDQLSLYPKISKMAGKKKNTCPPEKVVIEIPKTEKFVLEEELQLE